MNKIIMVWVVASILLGITAATASAAKVTPLATQPAALDALADEAISESVIWGFGATNDDGIGPQAGLLGDKWGNLYSTTVNGGTNGVGIVFELSPPTGKSTQWSERVLYSLGVASDDGAFPLAGLLADRWGNLYSTTFAGGTNGVGTVFELSPPTGKSTQWSERVLYSFGAASDDSDGPRAGLNADKWGNLYSTTADGGTNGEGTVFELNPPTGKSTQWSERVLHSFGVASDDGTEPQAGLLADQRGNLYSTTEDGGANDDGTVFELSPPTGKSTQWSERVLYSFGAASDDGVGPQASLLADQWGNLYSTTVSGGTNRDGTVFELSPPTAKSTEWSEHVLYSFGAASDDGGAPQAGLLADQWGNFYGTTLEGGTNDHGTAFELSLLGWAQ